MPVDIDEYKKAVADLIRGGNLTDEQVDELAAAALLFSEEYPEDMGTIDEVILGHYVRCPQCGYRHRERDKCWSCWCNPKGD